MNRTTTRLRRALVTTVAAFATLAATALASAPVAASPLRAAPVEPTSSSVDLVDADATPETRSLFAYLRDVRGQGILFGHQHATDYGESFAERDGVAADVLAATGDYPAVFGFDTLTIEGRERPGLPENTREENALLLADGIREATSHGAISTLSMHMENVVTGDSFYDTTGDTLRAVLPGGSHHDDLVAYLDLVALTAHSAVDDDGNAIPIVFRPWHENAGSWFWWGASFGSPGEYAELFRFTVEYLRDVKDVHNLLYAFSPGGGFGGSAEQYLRTYPGDDFIDVLGFDVYDASASPTFLAGLVDDLGMVAGLADERGKISALTEFGITGGVQPDGSNSNLEWYTDVLDAITSDPAASRMAYMLTWANFGGTTSPYTPVDGEMLPDFLAFHDDPMTVFAPEVEGAFDRVTEPVAARPVVHLASPADGSRVAASPVTLRATVDVPGAERATLIVDDAGTAVELTAPADGGLWWTGTWELAPEELDNSTRSLTLEVVGGGSVAYSVPVSVVVGPRPELPAGVVDDFEGYGDDTALRSEYVQFNANTIGLARSADGAAVGDGDQALRFDYSFATQSYTGVGRQVAGDWSPFWDFEAWVDPDASGNRLVLQVIADGVAFEAYPSLAGDEPYLATIPFADWRPAPWDTAHADRRLDEATRAKISQFNVYVNAADGGATSGSLVLDGLRAVPGTPPPPVYADVPRSDPDYAAIAWLHDEVVDLGDAKGRFHPNRAMGADEAEAALRAYLPGAETDLPDELTRAALAERLWRLAGAPEPAAPAAFADVPASSSAADAVAWVVEQGVIAPASGTRFGVDAPVKRDQFARYLFAFDAVPRPVDPVVLFDFASGADGWAVASWESDPGTAVGRDGRLVVDAGPGGDWVSSSGSLDLTGRTALLLDVPATTGFDAKAALQLGSSWTWCETGQTGWVQDPRTGAEAVAIDLTTLSAECAAMLGDVRGINVFLNEGHHELDAIGAR
ncbi:glycosyl hydrolase [Agromyces aurantiacus]|uniref:Glycosyl hydrolase n=1 Tax=Agromyces aurantiacus TaxID=165814 RepID=A0ABV9R2J2_9MICO|nr:glycosyl hydrolase [Agromyces aurantiacus]MBM7502995.1 mannan endo-1,4-beta-mannosidase [Agromyces aurantiacus]